MKKLFTLLLIIAAATTAFAQSPFSVNDNGLSVAFCSDIDVNDTSYIAHGSENGFPGHQTEESTSSVSLVDGGLKLEGGGDNFAWVRFKIDPAYSSYIVVTGDYSVSLKYKELNAEAFPLVIRTDASGGFNSYGAELWLEDPDVTVGSSDWLTYTAESDDWFLEDWDPEKVTAFEVAIDGGDDIEAPSVIIDDIVFGGIELQVCETSNHEITLKPKMDVYPNPASDFLRFDNAGPVFNVAIFNTMGQQVLFEQNPEQMDISVLNSGLYFVKVSNDEIRDTFKVLVK